MQPSQQTTITALANNGAGVGRLPDGKAVFVYGALPGELVVYASLAEHSTWAQAEVAEVLEPAPERVAAKCPYAGVCGGCPWQVLDYDAQLLWKRRLVLDALVRIAGFDADAVERLVAPCRPSDALWGYRNKAEFEATVRDGRLVVGMHAQGASTVVPVRECLLLPKQLRALPHRVGGALGYALRDAAESLHRIGVRHSQQTHDTEVAIWSLPGPMARGMVAKVVQECAKTTSIVRVLTEDAGKARKLKKVEVLSGKGLWRERLGGFTMMLSAPSFFQVNTPGAQVLVELVLTALDDTGVDGLDHVLDLYSGAGTFTLPLAERYLEVSAVESYSSSIGDLRRNLQANGLDAEVIGGSVDRELPRLSGAQAAVIDPPRAGLGRTVCTALIHSRIPRLVYVSCDPATMARDLRTLSDGGFELRTLTPVDLFPQTAHVECVAVLTTA